VDLPALLAVPAVAVTVTLLAAVAAALVVTAVVALVVRVIARRREWAARLVRRARRPFRVLLVVVAVWIALRASVAPGEVRDGLDHLLHVITIVAAAWLVCALAIFFEDLGLSRYRVDVADNRVARRVRTQVLIIRRLTVVAIVVVAIGAILLTFPGARAAGASVLASAGLVSIVAGLAAQSTLANVFAGMQLAFSDAIRVDDVVIVETEWGRVEEITLTYVVVHIWDDRRMVLPSTYFTTTPFQNWTRTKSELLGAVELDLDWRATPASMREELDRVLATTDLWDGRVSVLQVTDAVGGFVRIRVLVSAVDAPTLFDLRCLVRERLVAFLHEHSPQSLPRTRVQMMDAHEPDDAPPARRGAPETEPTGLFSGTAQGDTRAGLFTGPISTVPAEERIDLEVDGDRWRTRD
jgi:small-conductance mechanosensitive channel